MNFEKKLIMKKTILLVAVVLISFSFSGQSQKVNRYAEAFINDSQNFVTNNTARGIKDKNATGSKYVSDFSFGKVIGYNQNYLMRYDAYNDQMEVKNTEDKVVIINKKTINEVTFNNGSKYKIYNYTLDGNSITGYLKVIYDGSKSSLLKKEVIRFIPEKKAESSYDSDVPAAYKKGSDVYFIADHNGAIRSFGKKKELLKLFPAQKKAIDKFIKANNVRFSNEVSLAKLGRHLDEMN